MKRESYNEQDTYILGYRLGKEAKAGEVYTLVGNLIEDILPEHYKEITIEKDLEKGFDYRRISICEY